MSHNNNNMNIVNLFWVRNLIKKWRHQTKFWAGNNQILILILIQFLAKKWGNNLLKATKVYNNSSALRNRQKNLKSLPSQSHQLDPRARVHLWDNQCKPVLKIRIRLISEYQQTLQVCKLGIQQWPK